MALCAKKRHSIENTVYCFCCKSAHAIVPYMNPRFLLSCHSLGKVNPMGEKPRETQHGKEIRQKESIQKGFRLKQIPQLVNTRSHAVQQLTTKMPVFFFMFLNSQCTETQHFQLRRNFTMQQSSVNIAVRYRLWTILINHMHSNMRCVVVLLFSSPLLSAAVIMCMDPFWLLLAGS